ncbi:MAG TPA: hypothetical protein VGE95_03625, partial [Arthrobacter sp.]
MFPAKVAGSLVGQAVILRHKWESYLNEARRRLTVPAMSSPGGGADPLADEGLTRRLKALACTAPLHDLDIRKANQPWLDDGDRYQMAEVALDIIDQVAIAMDFESGARHAQVLERAQRFIARQAPDRP